MNRVAWSGAVVLLVAAVGAADSACTVTVTGDDGGGGGGGTVTGDDEDAAQPDAEGEDGGAAPDSSTCSVAVSTGSTACDDCIESNCCSAVLACDSEPPTNANSTDCEEIDSCYGDCLSPPADSGEPAGTPSDCASLCSTSHSAQGESDFTTLQSCTSTSCASECQ